MMKITGLSHHFKWENLHNWWLTKYFLPHCMLTQLEKFDLKDILLLPQTNNKHILSPSFIKAPLCIVAIGQQRPLVNDCTTLHQLA